jgi:cell division protein FtsB
VNDRKTGGWKKKAIVAAFAFLLFVLLVTSFFGKKGLIEIYRARKIHAALLQEIAALEKRKAQLAKDVAALERDPKAVDKTARDQLWLMKPDEKVIVKTDKK